MTSEREAVKPQRILITGGAGFIGSHTADLLLQQERQVVVLDNLFSGKLGNLNLQNTNLEFIEGDVLEFPYLQELIADCDAVLHLAAIASVPLSIEDPIYSFQVNTQGFLHVLQAVHLSKKPVRIVYASSAAVYGDAKDLPCRDDAPLREEPLSPYALQKVNAEQYASLYARLHRIKSLGLRYFNVYGNRQDPNSPYSGVISRFLENYQKGDSLTVFGDGQQSRDFIEVSDVARANVLALDSPYHGVLNIATGVAQTLLQLVEYIQEAGKKPASLAWQPARLGDIKSSYGSISSAKSHLSFQYATSLREGIQKMVVEK
jgi:UDP-glucose 4-epimerase